MTKSQQIRERAVMISSTIPSTKYSCSGSPLMLANGSTAIDGLSGGEGRNSLVSMPSRRLSHSVCPDRPRDILERLLAHVFEGDIETACGILLNAGRDADAAWLGQAFEPRRDIDAVAKDIAVLDDDIALVNADPKLDAPIRWQYGIALGHCRLHLSGRAERVDDAGELDQEAVAGGLDDAALMVGDLRIDDFGAQHPEPAQGPFLVGLDQARVAGDIGRDERREPTFDASWPCGLHGASSVADDPTRTGARRALSTTREAVHAASIFLFFYRSGVQFSLFRVVA